MPPKLFLFLAAFDVPLPVSCIDIAASNAGSIPYLFPALINKSPALLRTPPRDLLKAPLALLPAGLLSFLGALFLVFSQ